MTGLSGQNDRVVQLRIYAYSLSRVATLLVGQSDHIGELNPFLVMSVKLTTLENSTRFRLCTCVPTWLSFDATRAATSQPRQRRGCFRSEQLFALFLNPAAEGGTVNRGRW